MFQSIVVPLDGSEFAERALDPALLLAERAGVAVHVITTAWGSDAEEPRRYLENIVAGELAVPIEIRVVSDRFAAPAVELVTRDLPEPLVCMTTHGRGGFGQALLGSVAEEVVRTLGEPVLLFGPAFDPAWPSPFANLVACYDGSPAAEAIVPTAVQWAEALRMRASFVEVLRPEELRKPGGAVGLCESTALRALAQRLEGDGVMASWEVIYGADTAGAIVDFARRLPASILALSTHGRSGLSRVTVGSVAMKVVRESPCPVLVLRPASLTA